LRKNSNHQKAPTRKKGDRKGEDAKKTMWGHKKESKGIKGREVLEEKGWGGVGKTMVVGFDETSLWGLLKGKSLLRRGFGIPKNPEVTGTTPKYGVTEGS